MTTDRDAITTLDYDHDGPEVVIQHLHGLTNPSTTANHDPQVIQTRAMALFGQLKAHNRAANAQTRSHKQATTDARAQMDQAHLALQNLLYEKRHLEREIEKCRQFAYVFFFSSLFQFVRSSKHGLRSANPIEIDNNEPR